MSNYDLEYMEVLEEKIELLQKYAGEKLGLEIFIDHSGDFEENEMQIGAFQTFISKKGI